MAESGVDVKCESEMEKELAMTVSGRGTASGADGGARGS
jgi:hypothetical protein